MSGYIELHHCQFIGKVKVETYREEIQCFIILVSISYKHANEGIGFPILIFFLKETHKSCKQRLHQISLFYYVEGYVCD